MGVRIFNIICWAVLVLPLPTAAQRLVWKNYTTEHGLPGNEVYDLHQDRHGYLWFATEAGICRFNGYDFYQPADTSAQRGSEAFTLAEDAGGRMWFTRLDGSVWLVDNDTVRAWRHNARTEAFRKQYLQVENLAIGADGTVCLGIVSLGLLAVRADGGTTVLPQTNGEHFVFAETGGELIYSTTSVKDSAGRPMANFNRPYGVLRWKNGKAERLVRRLDFRPLHHSQRGIWKLCDGDLVLASRGTLSLLRDGKIVWQRASDILPRTIVHAPTGDILAAVPWGKKTGLFRFATVAHLRRNDGRNLLPGHFVTDVRCDPAGGWWASTQGAGIFYCKNPLMEVFDMDAGLPSNEVTCLATDGEKTIFAGFLPADVVAIDCESGKVERLPRPALLSTSVHALYFDRLRQRLWCSDGLTFFEKNKWTKVGGGAKNIMLGAGGSLWSGGGFGFFRTDAETGATERFGKPDSSQNYQRTFSAVEDRKGNIWVTTNSGLRLWRHGRFEPPPFRHPALRFQPRHLALLFDGGMAIGLMAGGVLIRNPAGRIFQLDQSKGMSSDAVTKLVVVSGGRFFACTNKGLNRITRHRPDDEWLVEVINSKQGLPSSQVNDAVMQGGYVWVATNKGLARFREGWAAAPMPPPVLEKLLVNNQQVTIKPYLRLAHDQNNLALRFFALHYRSEGDIQYQYRLLGAVNAAFVRTNEREVNFANLAPGKYTLEVQAQNESGHWAEHTRWSFVVRAAWWQTPWFWAALALLMAAGLRLYYLRRLRKNREEAALQAKIRYLEVSALRAQINPHFIYNCLNSILHFINNHDAASATKYLGRFARLVRLALHGSVDGRHSLLEEIEMLNSYLTLEQMRFQGAFVFTVVVEADMEADAIYLPPMLVQPFVENALLHGMKNKSEGGRIAVAFALEGDTLVATVTDNGPGYDGQNRPPGGGEPGHKSVGMMLTQNRLDALATAPGESAFSIEAVRGADGVVCGTRVVLRVPVG
ncbi:MAG: histidine kinase [Saprospiraceae bacterium]